MTTMVRKHDGFVGDMTEMTIHSHVITHAESVITFDTNRGCVTATRTNSPLAPIINIVITGAVSGTVQSFKRGPWRSATRFFRVEGTTQEFRSIEEAVEAIA